MDNAQYILKQILEGKYQRIMQFISDGQEEHLWLDFKENSDPTRPGISGDDKKNYAKALSGFSNANGGVVVWGIKARKESSHSPDVACESKPIMNVKRFLTDLNSITGSALVPVNNGIQNQIIFVDNDESRDEGFVVTYVPETDGLPHRAMCRENIYYTRSGDSFYMLEHHQLADMFGKRQKPDLHIFYRLQKRQVGDKFKLELIVGIENKGRYLATYPALRLKPIQRLELSRFGVNGNSGGWVLFPQVQSHESIRDQGQLFSGGVNDTIYPQTKLEVAVLDSTIEIHRDQYIFEVNPNTTVFLFSYEIFCEGCPTKSGEVAVTEDKLKLFIEL
ncbi:helix-turn-helix domain-containing protein [Pelosinus sp. UFO1]|uniref:AlbA family DNA-binding domain-containing protein n=1 Tax=Pelosinus sp. UFO1 TaxID=484770 RepID=UPI00057050CD|nr:ATP-binding protein [Pelosinus sp. UFO1]